MEGRFGEGGVDVGGTADVFTAASASDFEAIRENIHTPASSKIVRTFSIAEVSSKSVVPGSVDYFPERVAIICATALEHYPPRPKPGINKRPICAAVAGVAAETRVPGYWAEGVTDKRSTAIVCFVTAANTKYC